MQNTNKVRLFIAISFLISLLQGLIPYEKIQRYLSGKAAVSTSAALILAFITPFCSCSTIPVVVNLLNKKIRFGIILSVIIGFALERLRFESAVKNVILTGYLEPETRFSLRAAVKEMLGLMKSVYPYLIIGAAIGSVIHGAVPTNWISHYFGGSQWWLVPVAAIIGIPLYIRLSTMIPLSQILIAKGMAIAPVMALMISSAGASLPEITLLHSIFQKRLVLAFMISVFSMATISGLLFYVF